MKTKVHVYYTIKRGRGKRERRLRHPRSSSNLWMSFDLQLPLIIAPLANAQEIEGIQQVIHPPQPAPRLLAITPTPMRPRQMDLLPILLIEAIVPEIGLHHRALELEVNLREEVRDGDDGAGDGGDVDDPGEERVREEHAVRWGVGGGFLELEVGVGAPVGLDLEVVGWEAGVPDAFGGGGVVYDGPVGLGGAEHRFDCEKIKCMI